MAVTVPYNHSLLIIWSKVKQNAHISKNKIQMGRAVSCSTFSL